MAKEESIKIGAFDPIGYCGMLYDSRSKKFIPGVTLEYKSIEETKCGSIKSDILTEKEYHEKKNHFNVSGSLKFDFKMVKGGISGSYTSDQTSSRKREKVFLDCNIMTKHKKAIFDLEGPSLEKNRHVISSGLGTHVVAAIEYGGNAVIEFEMDNTSDENSYKGEGSLNASLSTKVKELGSITGKGEMSGGEKDSFEKVKIKFIADFTMAQMPTKLEKCMEVYQKISEYAGEGLPHTIHLLPLTFFEVEVPKVIQLDQELVDQAFEIRQILDDNILECKAFLEEDIAFRFPAFKNEVEAAVGLAKKCLERFGVKCSKIMKKIELGETEERELLDYLRQHEESPFQEGKFSAYLEMLEEWKDVFTKCHKAFTSCENIRVYEEKAAALEFTMQNEIVVCFKLEIPKKSLYQDDMHSSIRQIAKSSATEDVQHQNPDFHKDITTFLKLARDNEDEDNHYIFYFSKSRQPSNILSHAVEVYQCGNLISGPDFRLPCQVSGLFAKDISDCSAIIIWEDLEKGCGKTFEVKINNMSEGEDMMEPFTIKEGQTGICLKDLISNTKYQVAVRLCGASIENLTVQEDDGVLFKSTWSEPFSFRTKLARPHMSDLGDNRFRITWTTDSKYAWEVEVTKAKVTLLKEKIKEKEEKFDFTLEGDGSYQISVSVYNNDGTCRERYPPMTKAIENSTQLQNLRAELKQKAPVKSKDKPTVYLLPMEDVMIKARKGKQIGTFRPYMEERVVLVLGTSSEGRKRWMNMLVSSLLGVNAEDKYYFAVSMETTVPGEKSAYDGSGVFVYRICQVDGFHVPYTLTIVDTNDVPPEALLKGESLCKHITTILNKLGPGFNFLDAITIVHGKDLKVEDFKPHVTKFYKSKFDEHLGENIKFVTHDRPVKLFQLETNLKQQKDYLQALISCKNIKCRRWRFRLWHACSKIQKALVVYLRTENQRLHLLRCMGTERETTLKEDHLETIYEELLPEVKAPNCLNCGSTCQPFCTEEEAADTKKCAVIKNTSKNQNAVPKCTVCPEECGMEHHRLEGEIIVEKSIEIDVTSDDVIMQDADPSMSNTTPGAVIGCLLKNLKENEVTLKTQIQNGLEIFKELRPDRSVKDFFNLLQSHVSDDNKASREDCMHWIKKQKGDPGAMKALESVDKTAIYRCETCYKMYGQKPDCLAKVPQNNFLVPSFDKDPTGNMAERLSPMHVWDKTKSELMFEKNTFTSILKAYEFQHAVVCQSTSIAEEIMATDNPRKIKSLANKIPKQNDLWDVEKEDVLMAITQAAVKNKDFKEALKETGSRTIGYLGGPDRYLGIGLDRKHSQNLNPRMWPGLNKYGELLMAVRNDLM